MPPGATVEAHGVVQDDGSVSITSVRVVPDSQPVGGGESMTSYVPYVSVRGDLGHSLLYKGRGIWRCSRCGITHIVSIGSDLFSEGLPECLPGYRD